MEQGKFVIKHEGVDVVSIADVPAGAEYVTVIIDAIRQGKHVGYASPLVEEINIKTPTPAALKALKGNVHAERADKVRKPVKRVAGRRRASTKPEGTTGTPIAKAVEAVASRWKQGDVVFLAWSSMSASQREAYDDMREAMGTVEAFRRGQGIRRTVGVKFDTASDINWFTPDELSDTCEFCIEERKNSPEIESEEAELQPA
jgi:hypothetical protein